MTTNLLPISSDGGFTTAGNITTASYASPAPSLSGFSTVSAENFRLMSGNITGGLATVVTDGINSIALALGAQMDVFGFPFSAGGVRGQLTISDVTTPSEVNGTWYYQSVNTNTYQIYTNSTYSTLVDATGWSAYTGGGNVAITKQVPAANIVINTNGYFSKFDNTGNLTLPGNLSVVGGTISLTGEGIIQSTDDTVALKSLNTSTGNANSVYLGSSGGLGFNDQAIGGNWLEIFRSGTEPQITVPPGVGNLTIATSTGITPYLWAFTNTGNLVLPGNTFSVNYANGTQVSLGGGNISTISNGNSNVNIATANGNVSIAAVGNTTMTITGTGANIAGTANISGNVIAGNLMGPLANGNSNVTIATAAGNVVTNVNAQTILTVYTGGIKVGGSGVIQSPGGATAITLNNNGANLPIANITNTLNVTGAAGANITANLTAGNISTGGALAVTGNATVTGTLSSTGKLGYTSGSSVTQTTNRGNGVTINTLAGTIITTSAAMVANEIDTFSVTNSSVDPNNDIVLAQIVSPNQGTYNCIANPALIGGFNNGFFINIQNISGFTTSNETITIRFMVIKAPNA